MALVSVTEAAKLVRRGRASLYRDIEKGRLSKTITETGDTGIETSELVRVYGRLYSPEKTGSSHETTNQDSISDFAKKLETFERPNTKLKESHETFGDTQRTDFFEEKARSYEQRIELLERIVALEATVRRDTVAALKAQLEDKNIVIKALENQVLMLGYTKSDEKKEENTTVTSAPASLPAKGWLSRIFKR